MAFQFIHLEAYSRKADKGGRSTSFVFDEAERQPHASLHVEAPEPPELVYGVPISDLRMMHDQAVADAHTVNKDGKKKAIRVDQKTLLTVVASHPYTAAECASDPTKMAEYEVWERDTVQWLRDQYGDNLKTVVRHSDESHMHIHAYILPEHLKALELHPGVSAKRREKAAAIDRGDDAKTANKSGDVAYKASMRQWQDSYYDQVAMKHGLARLGPKLRRLSKGEWQREKAAAQALRKTVEKAAVVQLRGHDYIRSTKAKAAEIARRAKADADIAARRKAEAVALAKEAEDCAEKSRQMHERAQKQASDAAKMLERARSEANLILSSAKQQASRMIGFGSRLRSFWSGLRIDKVREQVAKEKEQEFSALHYSKKALEGALEHEKDRRRDAEQRASVLSATLREMRDDLARAQARVIRRASPIANADYGAQNTRKIRI